MKPNFFYLGITLLAIFSITDLITTYSALGSGYTELNPLFNGMNPLSLAVIKLGATVFVIALLFVANNICVREKCFNFASLISTLSASLYAFVSVSNLLLCL